MPAQRVMSPHTTEEGNRTNWFLTEYGRFPTVDKILNLRERTADLKHAPSRRSR